MGSNEAGERRAGKEETLLRFPDGLTCTHVHKHMQVHTYTHTHTLMNTHGAKVHNYIAMHMGEYLKWRHMKINTKNNYSFSQAAAIKCVLCAYVSVCSGWQMKRRYYSGKVTCCIASADAPM